MIRPEVEHKEVSERDNKRERYYMLLMRHGKRNHHYTASTMSYRKRARMLSFR